MHTLAGAIGHVLIEDCVREKGQHQVLLDSQGLELRSSCVFGQPHEAVPSSSSSSNQVGLVLLDRQSPCRAHGARAQRVVQFVLGGGLGHAGGPWPALLARASPFAEATPGGDLGRDSLAKASFAEAGFCETAVCPVVRASSLPSLFPVPAVPKVSKLKDKQTTALTFEAAAHKNSSSINWSWATESNN